MKLKVSKGELIISNGLEMEDDYLHGGVGAFCEIFPGGTLLLEGVRLLVSKISFKSHRETLSISLKCSIF